MSILVPFNYLSVLLSHKSHISILAGADDAFHMAAKCSLLLPPMATPSSLQHGKAIAII